MTKQVWLILVILAGVLTGCGNAAFRVPPSAINPSHPVATQYQQAVERRINASQAALERAVSNEESVIVRDPTGAFGYMRLAGLFWRLHQPSAAIQEARRATQLQPTGQNFVTFGQLAWSVGQYRVARGAFTEALTLNKAAWWADVGLAQIAMVDNQDSRAHTDLMQAVAIAGPQGPIMNAMGQLRMKQSHWERAATDFAQAIRMNSSWWRPYYEMAKVDLHWGRVGSAQSNLRIALNLNPISSKPWLLLQSLPTTHTTRSAKK